MFAKSLRSNPVALILLIAMAVMGISAIVGGLKGIGFLGYIGVGPNDAWVLGSILLVISILAVRAPHCFKE
ncbi:MAG: hypothetical protein ACE5KV_05825 [Thermoplasmata archaeon]